MEMLKRSAIAILVLLLVTAGCTREVKETTENTATRVAEKVEDALDIATPLAKDDPAAREKERFDEAWRQLQSFRDKIATGSPQGPSTPELNLQFVKGAKETFKGLTAETINGAPISVPIRGDVAGPSVLKTQVYLDRVNFSVGAIDGRWGRNSAISLWWYQRARGLEATGEVDEPTFRSLAAAAGGVPAVVRYRLTADDVSGPFKSIPEDVYEKAKLDCLCYESAQEKIAERHHIALELLEKLNPDVKFSELKAGDEIVVTNVRPPVTADRRDIARVVVSIAGNTLNAYDAAGNLLFHGPTTLGTRFDPSPNETLQVKKIVQDPHFHYQPKLFHEVDDDEPEANLNPGPNSPVGVVWIALSKPHFGIHGTSDPEAIGYASSHGCVRLTNWDAKEIAHRIGEGVPVAFIDTRQKSAAAAGL